MVKSKLITTFDLDGKVLYKECSKCGEVKHRAYFSSDRQKKYGLRSDCKECNSKYRKLKPKKEESKNLWQKIVSFFIG